MGKVEHKGSGGGGREWSGGGGGGEVRSTTQAAVGVVLCWCVGVEGSVAAAAALCTCGGKKRSKNWVIQQCFSSFGIYLCSISLSSGFWGGAWARDGRHSATSYHQMRM